MCNFYFLLQRFHQEEASRKYARTKTCIVSQRTAIRSKEQGKKL